jgi:rhamnosyltransferase subunit B
VSQAHQRIHVLAFGSLGDVLPLATLGAELARRGHKVSVWCGQLHMPLVQRMGLHALPLDAGPLPTQELQKLSVLKTPLLWRRVEQAWRSTYPLLEAEVAALTPGAPRPLLVASSFALAGRLAQEKLDLKLVSVHLSPMCMASFLDMPTIGDLAMPSWMPMRLRPYVGRWLERALFDPVTAPSLNVFRTELGLKLPVSHVFSQWMHSPDLVLGLFPAWFAPPQKDWPAAAQLLDFPLVDGEGPTPIPLAQSDIELDDFLRAGSPPVAFYPGSARRDARSFFRMALSTCHQQGRRALLLTRYAEQAAPMGALPPWALHRAYVPFAQLLPQCAALVHCRGIGTLAQALQAGCPQLLLPHHFDQFDNAARLRRLGLAQVHRGSQWAGALAELLADKTLIQACQAQKGSLASSQSVLADAAAAVERLLG